MSARAIAPVSNQLAGAHALYDQPSRDFLSRLIDRIPGNLLFPQSIWRELLSKLMRSIGEANCLIRWSSLRVFAPWTFGNAKAFLTAWISVKRRSILVISRPRIDELVGSCAAGLSMILNIP